MILKILTYCAINCMKKNLNFGLIYDKELKEKLAICYNMSLWNPSLKNYNFNVRNM